MTTKNGCECMDAGCPVHERFTACERRASTVLYRVDMEDESGTAFCLECSIDAMESGLFTDVAPVAQEEGR